jgi:hypothetical protein
MPANYVEKTPPELVRPHFNFWRNKILTEEPEKKFFIRTRVKPDGEKHIRGFLSGKYNVMDNLEIMEAIMDAFKLNSIVRTITVSENYLNTQITFPDFVYDGGLNPIDKKQDYYFIGLNIVNSEVGLSKIKIRLLVWRQWCSNGATTLMKGDWGRFEKKHTGTANLPSLFSAALNNIGGHARPILEMFAETKRIPVSLPTDMIHAISREKRIPNWLERQVVESFYEEPGTSMFNVINAFTSAAHSNRVSIEDRMLLENIGGGLIGKTPPKRFLLEGSDMAKDQRFFDNLDTMFEGEDEDDTSVT